MPPIKFINKRGQVTELSLLPYQVDLPSHSADLEALFDSCRDDYMFTGFDSFEALSITLASLETTQSFLIQARFDLSDPITVGYAGLSESVYLEEQTPTFDYGIHPEFRRLGLGSNTIKLLALTHAEQTGNTSADVLGEIEEDNAASVKVFESLGARDLTSYYHAMSLPLEPLESLQRTELESWKALAKRSEGADFPSLEAFNNAIQINQMAIPKMANRLLNAMFEPESMEALRMELMSISPLSASQYDIFKATDAEPKTALDNQLFIFITLASLSHVRVFAYNTEMAQSAAPAPASSLLEWGSGAGAAAVADVVLP